MWRAPGPRRHVRPARAGSLIDQPAVTEHDTVQSKWLRHARRKRGADAAGRLMHIISLCGVLPPCPERFKLGVYTRLQNSTPPRQEREIDLGRPSGRSRGLRLPGEGRGGGVRSAHARGVPVFSSCHAAGCSWSPSWGRSRSWCLSHTVVGVWKQKGPGMHTSRDACRDMHFAMTACRHSGPIDTAPRESLRLPVAAPWARSLLALGSAAWCCVAGPRMHAFSKVLYIVAL